MPPQLDDWLPEDHLVYFVRDTVRELDLAAIYDDYNGAQGGYPPYNPTMMTGLLLYAYCVGKPSSRKIERATYESIPFRVLAADQHPDHDTIAAFRRRHLKALAGLFVQVLQLCQKAGLVKLGHVALDGTKIHANASKHKAMSYQRMCKSEAELAAEIERLLREAEQTDRDEDGRYGQGRRGDELPETLRRKQSRLQAIRRAKKELQDEARQRAEAERPEYEEKLERWNERNGRGRKPRPPSEKVDPKAQRNFTDPDSRIMKSGNTKSLDQSYNGQAATDESQVILAADVTQQANDKQQIEPMVEAVKENLDGRRPEKLSADAGYYSDENIDYLNGQRIDTYIPTGRTKHGETPQPAPRGRIPKNATAAERMRRKLQTVKGRATYRKRKWMAEAPFGQIKSARGFRAFLLRGLESVRAEWQLICLTHNLLKLFKASGHPATG